MTYVLECVYCHDILLTTARVGDAVARIVADHLEARHAAVLDSAVDFDDPGLAKILRHVQMSYR